MNKKRKKDYQSPEAQEWELQRLHLLEQMSITGEFEEFEDGGDI